MNDVRELIPELDLIPVERTSLMPAEKPKRVDPAPIRRKHTVDYRDKVIVTQWMIIAAFAVLTYILQVGPI